MRRKFTLRMAWHSRRTMIQQLIQPRNIQTISARPSSVCGKDHSITPLFEVNTRTSVANLLSELKRAWQGWEDMEYQSQRGGPVGFPRSVSNLG